MPENSGHVNYPERVILTDDPLRAKMLAAHHLEHAKLIREQGDTLEYLGSYNGTAIALVSSGFDRGAVPFCARRSGQLGAFEIIYIGECVSSKRGLPLRSVIIAEGGGRKLLARTLSAAARYAIPAGVLPVAASGTAQSGADISDSVSGELYESAKEHGFAALAVLTVSENTETGERMEEHERRSRLYAAARLVFESMALNA